MADRKDFPTDEACALALLARELKQATDMDLSSESHEMLFSCIEKVYQRLAELSAEWLKSLEPSETAPVLTETPAVANTSSMPDSVSVETPVNESVTP